jgi:putative membrane protein
MEINAAEVQLGQLAETKAESKSVKSYAQMMVKDHSAALQKLQRLQSDGSHGAPALNAEHQELKTRLSGMSGSEFDRNYIDAMVMGHREAVKLFEQETTGTASRPQSATKPTENDVAAVAKELLPTIRQHLAQAEKIQKSMGATKSTTSSTSKQNSSKSSNSSSSSTNSNTTTNSNRSNSPTDTNATPSNRGRTTNP